MPTPATLTGRLARLLDDLPPLARATAIARRLNTTGPTLVRWSRAGKFPPAVRLGAFWHFSTDAVREHLGAQEGQE